MFSSSSFDGLFLFILYGINDITGPEIIDVNGLFQIPWWYPDLSNRESRKNSSIQDVRDYISVGMNELKIGEK